MSNSFVEHGPGSKSWYTFEVAATTPWIQAGAKGTATSNAKKPSVQAYMHSWRKNLWLRKPTQLLIHGQWWSYRITQHPQSKQWWARSGRGNRHFMHIVAFLGCHSFFEGAMGSAGPALTTKACHVSGRTPGSEKRARRKLHIVNTQVTLKSSLKAGTAQVWPRTGSTLSKITVL